MRYRVLEGEQIVWPDGSVRASEGQVFEGYDDGPDRTVANRGRALLRGLLARVVPAPDETITAPDLPQKYLDLFRAAAAEAKPRAEIQSPTLAGLETRRAEADLDDYEEDASDEG